MLLFSSGEQYKKFLETMRRHTKPKAVRELGSWKSIWEKYFPIVRVARERKPDLETSAAAASTENTAMKSTEKANKRSFLEGNWHTRFSEDTKKISNKGNFPNWMINYSTKTSSLSLSR